MTQYMSYEMVSEALHHFDYRHPAVKLSIFAHPYEGFNHAVVQISYSAPNAYKQGEAQDQRVNCPVPPMLSWAQFHDWLRWRMATIALHEVNEFCWVSGQPMTDPHSESYWELRILM